MRRARTNSRILLGGLLALLAASLVALIRRDIGQRTMPNLFRATGLALVVSLFYSFLTPPFPRAPFFPCFVIVLGALSLAHRLSVWFRREPGAIHSFSNGRTRLVLPWGLTFTERYFEPLCAVAAGAAVRHLDPLLGVWLMAAGVSLFVDEQIARLRGRTRVLDATDSRHEAAGLHSAVETRLTPKASPGMQTIPVRSGITGAARVQSGNFREEMDPALRRLIEPDPTNPEQKQS
jgi:hypothetical protein